MAQRYEIDFDLTDVIKTGDDGATFIPSVSEDGIISWTNDKGLPNPEARNIMGPAGPKGDDGQVYIHIVENAQHGNTYTITTEK